MSMSRSQAASIAALTRHGRGDTRKHTAPARSAFLAKFEAEADPDGVLDPAERTRRGQRLLKAHMLRLAAKSAAARKAAAP